MRDCNFMFRLRNCVLFVLTIALSHGFANAKEEKPSAQEVSRIGKAPHFFLTLALPKACAQTYPQASMIKKAAAFEAGFLDKYDSLDNKENWGMGWMLPPDATEEMRRRRQETIDKEWAEAEKMEREFFAPERIACLASHMQLERAQCEEFVNALESGEEDSPKPDEESIKKTLQAMEQTFDACVHLVKNWPGKEELPPPN